MHNKVFPGGREGSFKPGSKPENAPDAAPLASQ